MTHRRQVRCAILALPLSTVSKVKKRHDRTHTYGKAGMLRCLVKVCVCFSFVSPAIKEKYTDWTEFLIRDLTGSRTAPASLLEGVCIVIQLFSVIWSCTVNTSSQLRAPLHISFCGCTSPHGPRCAKSVTSCLFLNHLDDWFLRDQSVFTCGPVHKWKICFYGNTF